MKKIFYAIILAGATFFSSCNEQDDRTPITPDITDQKTAVLAADPSVASEFTISYSVTLPESYSQDAQITVKAMTTDFIVVKSKVDVPAGTTSVSGTIELPEAISPNTFEPVSGYLSLQVDGIALGSFQTVDGETVFVNDNNDRSGLTSNIVELNVYDRVQWPYPNGVVDGRMTILFDWKNPTGNDIDMYVVDPTASFLYESAESGDRWETDIFDDTHPDGDYSVFLGIWTASDTDEIPYRLFFVHPDQTTVTSFSGVFTSDDITAGFIFPAVNFTKSTDADGNVSYTFSQP